MPTFEHKLDFEETLRRMEAWWEGATLDRPPVSIVAPKPATERVRVPEKTHAEWREKWWDTAFQVELAVARICNHVWMGEALPVAWPNLGPEILAAFYGCELEYTQGTSWSVPILKDWSPESLQGLRLDLENPYFRKIEEMTDALLDAGRGRFIVGYTDLHAGGDLLASFRDPQALCMDMLTECEAIRRILDRVNADFLRVYDHFHQRLAAAGMPSTTWLNLTCRGRYHVPSNDFSCMISNAMFDEFFLPGIRQECRQLEASVYHLDGPAALRHLDSILEIPELNMLQWIYGAGNGRASDWIPVYQRCQNARKGIQLFTEPDELPVIMENLRPEGVWMSVTVLDCDSAEAVLKTVAKWR